MAVFKVTYYDLKDDQEHTHDIEYNGPEVSEIETWHIAVDMANKWCRENKVCFVGIMCISM